MHILTFDFEEWFHIFLPNPRLQRQHWDELPVMLPRITESILTILEKHKATATFFCLGWVANRYPQLIRDIAAAGHEVAAHSYWHEQVHKQSLSVFREDLLHNIAELESITGNKVVSYRAPAFTLFPVSEYAVDLMREAGIRYDSSIMSGMRYQGTELPNQPFTFSHSDNALTYYPVSTFPLFSRRIPYAGSGYYRMLPFRFVKKKLALPGYHMLYFHPRDLDDQLFKVKTFRTVEQLRFIPGTKSGLIQLDQLMAEHPMSSIIQSASLLKKPLLISSL